MPCMTIYGHQETKGDLFFSRGYLALIRLHNYKTIFYSNLYGIQRNDDEHDILRTPSNATPMSSNLAFSETTILV